MMSWTSDDQSETFDGADTSRGDDYTRGAHDSTGIRFELDALVVTLVVALGGALLDALLLHTLRTQLRSTLAPSGPEASGADGSDSATAQRSRRAGVEAAQSKSMEEREGERRATALPIALLMSNCVCSAVQCAFAVPAVTIEVFLPGTV